MALEASTPVLSSKKAKPKYVAEKSDLIANAARIGDMEKLTTLLQSLDAVKDVGLIDKLHGKLGKNALSLAAEGGLVEVIQLLLRSGASLNSKDRYECTAAISAARYGHAKALKVLFESGADINLGGYGGDTPLHICCRYNHLEAAKILQNAGADLERLNDLQETPFAHAIKFESIKVAEWLVQLGVNINAAGQNGDIPLTRCAFDSRLYPMLQFLLSKGADVAHANAIGETALHVACRQVHIETARSLVQANAPVDMADEGGRTPLMIACSSGSSEIVSLLLNSGASIDWKDIWGYSALMYACRTARANTAIEALLIERGANVNAVDRNMSTPLMCACKSRNYEAATLLLKNGANREMINILGQNAFDFVDDEEVRSTLMSVF